ncbi:MAG: EVE domain-containing protein [bacterium]|nr:EVE domain-containing protein [bacterium]
MKFWLMKTEPDVYSIDDLKRDNTVQWEGIRNYQARNFMMNDMALGDKVLFYHSNTTPPGVVGLAEVCKLAYPDYFAWDVDSKYFDPKSTKENPRWFMVDIAYKGHLKSPVSLDAIKKEPSLIDMLVIRRGMRLSIQPVTQFEYNKIIKMGAK